MTKEKPLPETLSDWEKERGTCVVRGCEKPSQYVQDFAGAGKIWYCEGHAFEFIVEFGHQGEITHPTDDARVVPDE